MKNNGNLFIGFLAVIVVAGSLTAIFLKQRKAQRAGSLAHDASASRVNTFLRFPFRRTSLECIWRHSNPCRWKSSTLFTPMRIKLVRRSA
jgi:hypothetical protein